MNRYLAPILACFLLIAGCADIQAVTTIGTAATGTVSQVAPAAMLKAKQVLTASHRLHQGVAEFMTIAANSDLCHATCATQAKDYLDRSEALLSAADDLVKLGDIPGINAKITAATALIAKAQALGSN